MFITFNKVIIACISGAIVYSIFSSSPSNKFSINPATAEIKTASTIDQETAATYTVVVHATDGVTISST